MSPNVPRLLAISDLQEIGSGALAPWLARLAGAEIDAIQLREKSLEDARLLDLILQSRRAFPGTLLVNGRADLAEAGGADGIHLPTRGLPLAEIRRRWPRLVIGCSTHWPEEVEAAQEAGADYVAFGPVFETPSKKKYGPPVGLSALREATQIGLPVLALGGIEPSKLEDVAQAGASGVAGIRCFQDPQTLRAMATQGRRLWPDADGRTPA